MFTGKGKKSGVVNSNVVSQNITLREQSPLGAELNEQYSLALLKMLYNEVLYRLRCRVEEEKKRSWFRRRVNVKAGLADYEKYVSSKRDVLEGKLSASIRTLHDLEDYSSAEQNIAYKQVFGTVSRIAIQSKFTGFNIKAGSNYAAEDSTLKCHYDKLNAILAQKEKELEGQLNQEKDFGFDKIPGYQTMSESDKRKYEDLFLRARVPAFAELPIARQGSAPSSVPQTEASLLGLTVINKIAHIYSDKAFIHLGHASTKDDLLKRVRSRNFWRGGSWSTEYKRVDKLLTAAEKPELDDNAAAETMIRIDRLAQRKMTDSNKSYFTEMKDAFEAKRRDRVESEMLSAFPHTPTLGKYKEYEKYLKTVYALPGTEGNVIELIRKQNKMPGQASAPLAAMDVENLPDKVADLQAMAYFIFLNNSVNGASLPCAWTQQGGLMITAPHVDLLNKLNGLFPQVNDGVKQSRALYLTVLMISIALTTVAQETNEYGLLRDLLIEVLDKKYHPRNVSSNTLCRTGFKYLLSYLPNNTLVLSPTETAQSKEALLQVFPGAAELTTRESINTVGSFRGSILGDSPQRNSREDSISNMSTQGFDQKKLSEPVRICAMHIAGLKLGAQVKYNNVDAYLKKNIEKYRTAHPEVLAVLTLLQWHRLGLEKGKKAIEKEGQDFADFYDGIEKQLVSLAKSHQPLPVPELILAKMPTDKSSSLGRLFSEIGKFVKETRALASSAHSPLVSVSRSASAEVLATPVKDNAIVQQLLTTPPPSSAPIPINSAHGIASYSMLGSDVDDDEENVDYPDLGSILSQSELEQAFKNAAENVAVVRRTGSASNIPIMVATSSQNQNISLKKTQSSSSIFGRFGTSASKSPNVQSWMRLPKVDEDQEEDATIERLTIVTSSPVAVKSSFMVGSPSVAGYFSSLGKSPVKPKPATLVEITNEVVDLVNEIYTTNQTPTASDEAKNLHQAVANMLNSGNYKAAFEKNNYQEMHKTVLVLYCVVSWYSKAYGATAATQCGSAKTQCHQFLSGGWKTEGAAVNVIIKSLDTPMSHALERIINRLCPGQVITNGRTVSSSSQL